MQWMQIININLNLQILVKDNLKKNLKLMNKKVKLKKKLYY